MPTYWVPSLAAASDRTQWHPLSEVDTEEERLTMALGHGTARITPGQAQSFASTYPNLAAQLAPFINPPAATTPTTPGGATTPGAATDTANGPLTPGTPFSTQSSGPLTGNFGQDFNEIISGLLNPPALFADTSRRAAEMGAARGISGSEAAFGTGLRMTDEERLRRQALGAELLTGRETAEREYQSLNLRQQELELRRQQVEADIALGNRTAANEEELTRIRRELADLEGDKLELDRDINASMGRATGDQRVNIAGTGFPANWVNFNPSTGRYT